MGFLNDSGVTKLVATLKQYFATKNDVELLSSDKQDKLISGTNIKKVNNTSLLGAGNISIPSPPTVTSSDNGKVLTVVNGDWAAAESGGGGGDVIVFYVQSLTANNTLYADPALTTTAMEFYEYDLAAAWSAVKSAVAIKIMSGYGTSDEHIAIVTDVEYDRPEDTIDLGYNAGLNGARYTASIS